MHLTLIYPMQGKKGKKKKKKKKSLGFSECIVNKCPVGILNMVLGIQKMDMWADEPTSGLFKQYWHTQTPREFRTLFLILETTKFLASKFAKYSHVPYHWQILGASGARPLRDPILLFAEKCTCQKSTPPALRIHASLREILDLPPLMSVIFGCVRIGRSRGRRRRALPTGSISFIFAYIFAKKCMHWRLAPPQWVGTPPPQREILDPPLAR